MRRPHQLVHYKKEGIVLIIRKILTGLPHGLPEVLIFTNANPVKRICSEFMCSHLLLLLDRAPVHTELASGELSSMQKPVRYTGTGCVRGGPSCARLIPLFLRPPIKSEPRTIQASVRCGQACVKGPPRTHVLRGKHLAPASHPWLCTNPCLWTRPPSRKHAALARPPSRTFE